MNELSQRFEKAIKFLKRNGFVKSEAEIARTIGETYSSLNMSKTGAREPAWDMLLNFCDHYPINFDWLRTGTGGMIKGARELLLLKRIEELENKISELQK